MKRKRFYDPRPADLTLRASPRILSVLSTLVTHDFLPANYIAELIERGANPANLTDTLTKLTAYGLVQRKTLRGHNDLSEMFNYWLTDGGRDYLKNFNLPTLPPLNAKKPHEAYGAIAQAQMQLGQDGATFVPFIDFATLPNTPDLPTTPFDYRDDDHIYRHDGRPFIMRRGDEMILIIDEWDRDSEEGVVIDQKLKNLIHFEKEIKARYNVQHLMVRFIAPTQRRIDELKGRMKRVFPKGSQWILFGLLPDHIQLCLSRPELSTTLYDTPYQRYLYPPFSLKTLR